MAENQERGAGRWTRSKVANPEEKGKSTVEEALQKIYLTILDESEEEFDIRNYIIDEEPGRAKAGKEGKLKGNKTGTGDREVEEEDQEEDEEEEDGRRVRSIGTRGRGNQRGRGGTGGRGDRGSRGVRPEHEEGKASEVRGRKRGKKDMRKKLQEAEEAYYHDTNPNIRRIIDHLEEEAMQEISDPEMEDWERFLPDPGHTRGRISLYKQSLHVY